MSVHFGQVWSFHLKAAFSLSSSDMKKELERGLNYPWHVSFFHNNGSLENTAYCCLSVPLEVRKAPLSFLSFSNRKTQWQ